MTIDIIVPELGESVTEATVARWFKAVGDAVDRDEMLVELETDKVNLEVTAQSAGVLGEVLVEAGRDVSVGAVLGRIQERTGGAAPETPQTPAALSPAVRKLVADHGLDPAALEGTGKDGRLLKGDVLAALAMPTPPPAPPENRTAAAPDAAADATEPDTPPPPPDAHPEAERERRVPMSRLRRRVAERLKQAQDTAAMLTTFNEVDMGAVMQVRAQYREAFEAKHGVRLGFMSFFVKAAVAALKEQPAVNAEIDGTDIVYKDYCHVGVAIGAPQGLVVPVLRDADRMGFAEIERAINDFAARARDGRLAVQDLIGGTFTISNGGVYGSMLSTPILNPPQSAILGMHRIDRRPMAVKDAVEIRPMMYLALSYDHRIIDGREAVTFLVRIRERIEDPRRLMLDI